MFDTFVYSYLRTQNKERKILISIYFSWFGTVCSYTIASFSFDLDVNQALDWTVCHGRAVALSYALFDAPGKLFEAVDEDEIIDAVIKYSSNDRVSVFFSFLV